MGVVLVGQTEISYELRRSHAASERRITITPGHVEVLALASDSQADVEAFLNRKRRWLFNTIREMDKRTANRATVPRFMSGSKIPYRGRSIRLTVRRHDGPHIELSYRNGLLVDLPSWVRAGDQDQLIATEIKLWLKQRVRRDVMELAREYGQSLDVAPRSIRVADMKSGWGSCGPSGSVLINWTLVFAPRSVLAYVVAHELAHLVERSHGPKFWKALGKVLPNYERPKAWLEAHQGSIDGAFLAPPDSRTAAK